MDDWNLPDNYKDLDNLGNIDKLELNSYDGENIKKLDFLPNTLKILKLPYNYQHKICNFPNSLIELWAPFYYNNCEFPNNLVELHLDFNFSNQNKPYHPISFEIDDIKHFDCSILPRTLKKLWLLGSREITMNMDKLPDLELLSLNSILLLNEVKELPKTLKNFQFYGNKIGGLMIKKYPENLEQCVLYIRAGKLELDARVFSKSLKKLQINCKNIKEIEEKVKYLQNCKMELTGY